jgi:hypothetical protein
MKHVSVDRARAQLTFSELSLVSIFKWRKTMRTAGHSSSILAMLLSMSGILFVRFLCIRRYPQNVQNDVEI